MNPIHLKLRNFMSYREEASLDFTTLRVACLAGDNGSGKSALLDAITWAIWGKTRASNDREVVALGELEMDVTFVFGLREREFRVFRRRTFGARAKPSLEFDVREVGAEAWVSLTGDDIRATEHKIVETLNLDYETFVNSAFILQGRADTFTQKTPGERKRILGDILNLGEYDELEKLARGEERELKQALARARGEIDSLDRRLEERPARLVELDTVSARLNEAGARLDLARELARALDAQWSGVEHDERRLREARSRLEREQLNLGGVEARIQGLVIERDRHGGVLAAQPEIERGVAEHERWRQIVADCAVTLRRVQAQSALRNAADLEIRTAGNELQRERDRAAARQQTAAEALERLARADAQLAVLQEKLVGAEDVRTRLALSRQTLQDRQHERSTLRAENSQHRARMDEIKASMELLQTGQAACPTCRRPLTAEDRLHFTELWTAEGTLFGDAYRSNREREKELERELGLLTEDLQRLEADDLELAGLRGQLAQLVAGFSERERHARDAVESSADITRCDVMLTARDYAHEARGRLAAADLALAELRYDPAAHEHAEEQERVCQPFLLRKQELELARSQHAAAIDLLTSLTSQRDELKLAAAGHAEDVEELAVKLAGIGDLRERRATAHDTVEAVDSERTAYQQQFGAVESVLKALAEVELQRDVLSERAAVQALDIGALSELVRAFGKDGIQAMIVENILPELEDEANKILRRMSSSQLQVTFRSQREALSSDKSIETLDIIIRDEYGERPYALYSGGEAFRVNFAVRVALSKLLARRAGARIDVLVVDEGFGTQDSRGRDGLIEALRSIENDFATILVITHIGEIRDLFPTRIDIVKTDRGSTISVQ